ncbi:MAG: hypothetical protein IPP23_07865 [Sphingomonadales bacterium]|nr:hypothetical protein [Sphingomonadales bacterium]
MIIRARAALALASSPVTFGRADTNERIEILQLDSAGTTEQAFRDWQTYTLATKGKLGLYHANIDPDAKYEMSRDQWLRAVEVLEEELGLQGQPRAIVMHEKNGREHIHVVWARTDMGTMKLRSDSMNYQAHERASLRLEQGVRARACSRQAPSVIGRLSPSSQSPKPSTTNGNRASAAE